MRSTTAFFPKIRTHRPLSIVSMATSSPPDGSDPSDELPRADSPSPESHPAAPAPGDKIAFAPTDYTDGRELLDWESHYPPLAKRAIRVEIAYLATGVVVSL